MNNPPLLPSEANWYYANTDRQPIGPFSLAELRQLKNNGTITAATLIIREGGAEWEPFNVALAFADGKGLPPSPISTNAIQEYRRQCLACGKVWHSLAKREQEIQIGMKQQKYHVCMCNSELKAQRDRNVAAHESELDRLRKCPDCQSSAYSEETVTHNASPNR